MLFLKQEVNVFLGGLGKGVWKSDVFFCQVCQKAVLFFGGSLGFSFRNWIQK